MTAPAAVLTGTYHQADGVLSRRTGSSLLVLVRDAHRFLRISGSGVALWDALAVPCTAQAAADLLAQTFGVDPEELRPDIAGALAQLVENGAVCCLEPPP